MKKILMFITAVFLFAGFAGCTEEPNGELVAGVQYYPASEGLTWEYRLISKAITWTSMTDTVEAADTSYFTVTCKETTLDDDTPVWEYAETGDRGSSYVYVKFGDTEIEIYEDKTGVDVETMPVKIEAGATWSRSEGVALAGVGNTTTVAAYTIENSEDVIIDGTTYTGTLKATAKATVSLTGTSVDAEYSEWYDVDAGLVKSISKAETEVAGVSYTAAEEIEELISYTQ